MGKETYGILQRLLDVATVEEIMRIRNSLLSEERLNSQERSKALRMVDEQLTMRKECA